VPASQQSISTAVCMHMLTQIYLHTYTHTHK
jgi:hypothetical protein